jgi:hypothetical protein
MVQGRAAEKAVSEARDRLYTAPATVRENSISERLAAVAPGITAAQEADYRPLLLPLGMRLGGFLLILPARAEGGSQASAATKQKRQNQAFKAWLAELKLQVVK